MLGKQVDKLRQGCDVFGEALGDAEPLRQRGPALEFEAETLRAGAIEAVHDPVILLDERRQQIALIGDDADQVGEILTLMEEGYRRHVTSPAREPRPDLPPVRTGCSADPRGGTLQSVALRNGASCGTRRTCRPG